MRKAVMNLGKNNVTLPEGVSLQRVAQVLLDAWEVGSHQWKETPLILRDGAQTANVPFPGDALELFRLLQERGVPYLLVGGIAMLTYVQGRNTKDVDLLMSLEAMEQVPEIKVEDRQDCFVRGKFRSVQVDLLLTSNPLFQTVADRYATKHQFAELAIPAATVEGLILLKLYALPSLYRQFAWDRVYVYEADIKQLIARYAPKVDPLLKLLESQILASDIKELRKMISEVQDRHNKPGEKPES
jgi:hypothetical protein